MRVRRGTGRRDWALFGVALLVNLAALYAPDTSGAASTTPLLDKVVHAAVFAAVAVTGLRLGFAASWFVPVLLAHAVVSEVLQHVLLPARSGDPWDAVADAAGVLLGWAAYRRWGPAGPIGRGRPAGG